MKMKRQWNRDELILIYVAYASFAGGRHFEGVVGAPPQTFMRQLFRLPESALEVVGSARRYGIIGEYRLYGRRSWFLKRIEGSASKPFHMPGA